MPPPPRPAPFTDPIVGVLGVTPLVSKSSSRVCLEPCYMPLLGRGARDEGPGPQQRTPREDKAGQGRKDWGAPSPCSLISPSFTCLEPPHLANLTLENASECLMQH